MKNIKGELIDSVYSLLIKYLHRLGINVPAHLIISNMPNCCTCALISERLTSEEPIVIYGRNVKAIEAKYMKEVWKSNDFIILNLKARIVSYSNLSILDIDYIKETGD